MTGSVEVIVCPVGRDGHLRDRRRDRRSWGLNLNMLTNVAWARSPRCSASVNCTGWSQIEPDGLVQEHRAAQSLQGICCARLRRRHCFGYLESAGGLGARPVDPAASFLDREAGNSLRWWPSGGCVAIGRVETRRG